MPGPVAMARQTSSGVPGTSTERSMTRSWSLRSLMLGFLHGARVAENDDAVGPAVGCGLVVIASGEGAHRLRQVGREAGAGRRRCESDVHVDAERRQPFARLGGPAQQAADLADGAGSQRDEVGSGEPVGYARR